MELLWGHLSRHHGVISRSEARSLGLSNRQIDHRQQTGEWIRIAPQVYRHRGSPPTWFGHARAHALSLDGVVSHRAAAVVWGIDGYRQGRVEITVMRDRKRRPRQAPIVHQSTQFDRVDRQVTNGVPVTGVARTVLDLAAVVSRPKLERTVDAVLRQGLVDWPDLYDVLVRHSRRGRDGCGKLRSFLDTRYGDSVVPDSLWNRLVAQLLESSGLPKPVLEHEIIVDGQFLARVDLAYPYQKVAIECDSVQFHLNRESFDADAQRRNRLMLAGWTVISVTWTTYRDDPAGLCATVRSALHRAPQSKLGSSAT